MNRGTRARLVVVGFVLLAGRVATYYQPTAVPLLQPLSAFPSQFAQWQGHDAPPFDAETERVLAADDYLNRTYLDPSTGVVSLYIGFYGSQQRGESIHSPQNCLPGSGWVPVERGRVTLQSADQQVAVNRYRIEKGGNQQLVLYWFQGRGRIVANEYVNKAFLLADALRLGRSDGALVRVITPVRDSGPNADAVATAFAQSLLAYLPHWLP